jgi:hypothetical protein
MIAVAMERGGNVGGNDVTMTSLAPSAASGVPPSPVGVRAARRRWRDPRLLVGVVLVVASVVAMAVVIGASDNTVAVWSVRGDVPSGSPLSEGDVVAVRVQLPDIGPYLGADSAVPQDMVAARDFAAGELLTMVGLESAGDLGGVRVVTLPVLRNQMPADLAVGDRVDVYVVERGSAGEPAGSPKLVLGSAVVADVDDDAGAFGGTSLETGVALSVPEEEVAAVVDAQARGTVTLVDVPVGNS